MSKVALHEFVRVSCCFRSEIFRPFAPYQLHSSSSSLLSSNVKIIRFFSFFLSKRMKDIE